MVRHAVAEGEHFLILEPHAGTYNEEAFAALDWVLDQASRRGLRIIIPFEVRRACLQGSAGAPALLDLRGLCRQP